jgi:hypothetical protein
MQVATKEIVYTSRSDVIKITPVGDIHYGGRDCNLKLLRACVRKIATDPLHYWIGMGDYAEWIVPTDPRFDFRDLSPEEKAEKLHGMVSSHERDIATELLPIKERCLGMIEGNHEHKLTKRLYVPVQANLCRAIGGESNTLDLGYSAIVKLRLIRKNGSSSTSSMCKVYLHHGAGGGRKKGAKVNRVEDLASMFPYCDIYVQGHVHDRICFISSALDARDKSDTIYDRPRAFGVTGTFKETYTQGGMGYGEQAQYPPTALGVITFTIRPTDDGLEIGAHSNSNGLPA